MIILEFKWKGSERRRRRKRRRRRGGRREKNNKTNLKTVCNSFNFYLYFSLHINKKTYTPPNKTKRLNKHYHQHHLAAQFASQVNKSNQNKKQSPHLTIQIEIPLITNQTFINTLPPSLYLSGGVWGECAPGEFRCSSGQCIKGQHRCDASVGERDGCADTSHLLNCSKLIIFTTYWHALPCYYLPDYLSCYPAISYSLHPTWL